ncbi:MAG: M50 family metallopeptidase [Candidatus Marsarchaeota archaeon]|nr:M50 family metallopeptidase [Candidatus Marsarchaeota archaeon]
MAQNTDHPDNLLSRISRVLIYTPESKRAALAIKRLSGSRLNFLFTYLGIPVFVGLALLAFYLILGTLAADVLSASVRTVERSIPLQAFVLIPGLNPFVPLVYGLVGLIVAVTVHEVSHGVMAWRQGVPVEGAGIVFLLFIPIGAFVRPSESQLEKKKSIEKVNVYTAGITANFLLALVCLGLIIFVIMPTVAVAPYASKGVAVYGTISDSPAAKAGLEPGDVIVSVAGHLVEDVNQLSHLESTVLKPGENVSVVTSQNQTFHVVLERDPSNSSVAILGITVYDVSQTLSEWTHPTSILQYFVPATYSLTPLNPAVKEFYVSNIPFWQDLGNLLFWLWWVSINLGVFNSLPAVPMDGGHVVREAFLKLFAHSKQPTENAEKATGFVSSLVLVMIAMLLFLPRII